MIEGKLNKEDSKYLKTALRLLRQGNTMLKQLQERCEITEPSNAIKSMTQDVDAALGKAGILEEYIADGKYVQLSLNFEEQ